MKQNSYAQRYRVNNIEDARVEQSKLLREVKQIKRGLDSLTTDTNHIANELHKKI